MAAYSNTKASVASTAGGGAANYAGSKVGGTLVGKIAGGVVQPVVWIATGTKPDVVDRGLYVLSLGSRMVSIPAAVTGLIKALVDDATLEKLKEVRKSEPAEFADLICPTTKYSGLVGQTINAMTIASKGGTSWQHPNGLWVYSVNPKTEDLYLYNPLAWKEICTPIIDNHGRPIPARDGYRWVSRRK